MAKEYICPLCNSRQIKIIGNLTRYYYCTNCVSARLIESPKISYTEDYYTGKSTLASQFFAPIADYFYKIRQDYIGNPFIKTWIDVGAGKGEFLYTVCAEKRIGVEISTAGRKIMEKNCLETLTPAAFIGRNNLRADVISFWHVLEHIKNPLVYLSAARKKLTRNGKVIIGVPNIDSWEYKLFGKYWFHLQPLYHLWHFSPKSLGILLKKAGLTVVKTDYWSIEHQPAGILQTFINVTGDSSNVLHKLLKRGTERLKLSLRDITSIVFWLTLGLPVVIIFWFLEVIFRKPGAFVVIASVKGKNKREF